MFHSEVGWGSVIEIFGWRVRECYGCVSGGGDRVLLVGGFDIQMGCDIQILFHSEVGWESEIVLVGWRVGECYECVLKFYIYICSCM